VRLPWGLEIEIDPADSIGHSLLGQGIYDLVTTEILWRLTKPGDRTIDVGANVGYMTSILARCAGPTGSVQAFEPHPRTFSILERNAERWNGGGRCAQIQCIQGALTDREGTARLSPTAGPADPNTSLASITEDSRLPNTVEVRCWKLTTFLRDQVLGVLKIDTEGHEARILASARQALMDGQIRDIVYEEISDGAARSHDILKACGYTLFAFEERFSAPAVFDWPHVSATRRPYDMQPSYLATHDPDRVKRIFGESGWHSLR